MCSGKHFECSLCVPGDVLVGEMVPLGTLPAAEKTLGRHFQVGDGLGYYTGIEISGDSMTRDINAQSMAGVSIRANHKPAHYKIKCLIHYSSGIPCLRHNGK